MADFQRRGLRDIGTELRAEFVHVVGEKSGLMAGARNGNVAETGIEQVWVDAGVSIDQDAFCGETLSTVAGDCIVQGRGTGL